MQLNINVLTHKVNFVVWTSGKDSWHSCWDNGECPRWKWANTGGERKEIIESLQIKPRTFTLSNFSLCLTSLSRLVTKHEIKTVQLTIPIHYILRQRLYKQNWILLCFCRPSRTMQVSVFGSYSSWSCAHSLSCSWTGTADAVTYREQINSYYRQRTLMWHRRQQIIVKVKEAWLKTEN